MNVPLNWLNEYVTLPKSEKELTDRLTMIGHMLDKRKIVEGEVVIDLELRGNRADMFGLIGVAREVHAALGGSFTLPPIAKLPKTDPLSPLISADPSVNDLVKRFIAIELDVVVGPSPAWLTERLAAYGIESFNNVIDVTNYVMVETSHPMHAFDADNISGNTLILRMAKTNEKFKTIQQGTTIKLTGDDIAIADSKGIQCLTCIGGLGTGVSDTTKRIILETAVYDGANSRRTARRHKIATEGGGRHEKYQDPQELPFALARAVLLLKQIADAKTRGAVSDYYPHPVKPPVIEFDPAHAERLLGIAIPVDRMKQILAALGCTVIQKKSLLTVTVPSFRTDLLESADLIEEIARIWGYENIPTETLSGALPKTETPAHILFEQQIVHTLQNLQVNQVITSTLIASELLSIYEQEAHFPPTIQLVNAPDPQIATLRPTLIPNLVSYAKRSLGFRQERIAFFEIGRIYLMPKPKRYTEKNVLGIIAGGLIQKPSWTDVPRTITYFDLVGIVQGLMDALGINVLIEPATTNHPSLDPTVLAQITTKQGQELGVVGRLHQSIGKSQIVQSELFVAEIDVDALAKIQAQAPQLYRIAPAYPPVIEDITINMQEKNVGPLIEAIKNIDPRVSEVTLIGIYEQKRTLRITYADPKKTLSGEDIKPMRERIATIAQKQFGATL